MYTVDVYEIEDYDKAEENMKSLEVVSRLENIARGWLPDYNYTGNEHDYETFLNHVAIDKAIKMISQK